MMRKLSIVIPCYNCQDNIRVLLNSLVFKVIQSNLDDEIEIVVVNDGSTDSTTDVLSDFYSYGFIKTYNIENSGAAKAREYGLSHSVGEYIFFCDSDDKVSDNFFDIFFKNYNLYDVIYFSSCISDLNNVKLYDKVQFENDLAPVSAHVLFNSLLRKGMWTAAVWTYIFKREIALNSKAYFTDRVAHEDHLFTLQILFSTDKIVCDSRLGYTQYSTPNSLTKKIDSFNYIYQRLIAYKEAVKFLVSITTNENIYLYKKWSLYSYMRLVYSSRLSIIQKSRLILMLHNEFSVLVKIFFNKFFDRFTS